jgi:predicted DCC family thiol-disulfide oxidoreductase YuxK
MKTLSNKIIIYDDVCPLCKAYTSGFVNIGWLLPDHRIGFSAAPKELLEHIDLDRARHEIPLYDTLTNETLYGKDALFCILGEEFPVFKRLFRWRIFRLFIAALYQIITYNRRIIAGSKAPNCGFDCAPDFNGFYRWLYIHSPKRFMDYADYWLLHGGFYRNYEGLFCSKFHQQNGLLWAFSNRLIGH